MAGTPDLMRRVTELELDYRIGAHRGGHGSGLGPPPWLRCSALLNGVTSGFVLPEIPSGFGYQIQKCKVIRSGCQNVDLAPLPGAVFGQADCVLSGMNVPSA